MQRLKAFDDSSNRAQVSEHAQEFARRLRSTQMKCARRRDEEIAQLQAVKQREREYWKDIAQFLREEASLEELEASRCYTDVIGASLTESHDMHETGDAKSSERSTARSERPSPPPFRSDSTLSSLDSSRKTRKPPTPDPTRTGEKKVSAQLNPASDPQQLSEELFRATLRSGVDDVAPFNFDFDDVEARDATEPQQPSQTAEPRSARRKRLMKGVAQTKLTLKPVQLKKRPPSTSGDHPPSYS